MCSLRTQINWAIKYTKLAVYVTQLIKHINKIKQHPCREDNLVLTSKMCSSRVSLSNFLEVVVISPETTSISKFVRLMWSHDSNALINKWNFESLINSRTLSGLTSRLKCFIKVFYFKAKRSINFQIITKKIKFSVLNLETIS